MSKLIKKTIKNNLYIYMSILPIAIFACLILVYPLINVIINGFAEVSIKGTEFIGLNNYKELLFGGSAIGGDLWSLIKNNFILFLGIPIQLFFSLFIAYTLHSEIRGWKVFRVMFYIPTVLSAIIIGYLVRIFFQLGGPVDTILKFLNLDFIQIQWLSTKSIAFIIIILSYIWHSYGMAVLVFLSGMSSMNESVLESAEVDGAGWWKRFFVIVIPMITGTIEFYLVILIIGFFTASFAFIYSITSGGPGYGTTTLEYMIYLKAFSANKIGEASALSTLLFVLVLIMVVIVWKLFAKTREWQE